MKSPELILRLIELAEAEPPAIFSVEDNAAPEDLDEALRIIAALRADPPQQ